MVKLLEYF